MPLGNGRVAVLAWGNVTAGGLDMYVRSPLAQHTDSQLYTIAKLSVALVPNPFAATGNGAPYWNQTLSLATATVTVAGGGSSGADYAWSLTAHVDANSDTVLISATSRDGITDPLSLSVTLTSMRPATRFTYGPLNFQCNPSSSGPDIAAESVPAPADTAASIALYHVNNVFAGDTSLFNSSVRLQGLGVLIDNGTFTDPLDGRIFGLGVTGGAGKDGADAPLWRTSATSLASKTPASSFLVRVAVRIDQAAAGNASEWLRGLAEDLVAGPLPSARRAASWAWWTAFWARSYISLPSSTPAPPRVGVFPCGGPRQAAQTMHMDSVSKIITLPGSLCFVPSSDGSSVSAAPCAAERGDFVLTPCTAVGCDSTADWWVISSTSGSTLGLPGAVCPWLDVWTKDDPTGVQKNELWYFNTSDSTLRTQCRKCPSQCVTIAESPSPSPSVLAAQYARTRFLQAVQSRGVNVPEKFNGQLFTSMAGSATATPDKPTGVDYRQWGPDHWWQNTRLPYGAQLIAGDFDTMRVLLDWVVGMMPLARARSRLLLGFDSVFWTETVNAFGLYRELLLAPCRILSPPLFPQFLFPSSLQR